MKEQPTYYSILTADVRYDRNLSDSEKLLYSEITALSNKYGYCTATNNYFAELYGVSKVTISRRISNLKKYGYLEVKMIKENKEIVQRQIYPLSNLNGGVIRSDNTPNIKSYNRGIIRDDKENNTSINNTSINNTSTTTTTNRTNNINSAYHECNSSSGGGVNEEFKELINKWHELGFGAVTERNTEMILDWLKKHDKDLISEVINYAHDMNVKNSRYVNAILKRLQNDNITTREQFIADTNSYNQKDKNGSQNSANMFLRNDNYKPSEKIELSDIDEVDF